MPTHVAFRQTPLYFFWVFRNIPEVIRGNSFFQWVTKYTKKDGSLVFKTADRSITTLHKRNNVFDEACKFRVGLLKSGKKLTRKAAGSH
jgi:hypothetical protein